jgi:hypothetical protein
MYANAPHASVTPPVTLPSHQPPSGQPQHGQPQPQGRPPAAYGVPVHAHAQAPAIVQAPLAPQRAVGAAYVTGAYQSSGDPAIDRMLRLEAACKRFGSPV